MKKYGLVKTKLNKRNFEILRNIELICFIAPKYIKDYSTFLKSNLKDDKEINLYNYLEKQWLNIIILKLIIIIN